LPTSCVGVAGRTPFLLEAGKLHQAITGFENFPGYLAELAGLLVAADAHLACVECRAANVATAHFGVHRKDRFEGLICNN
jgi:hypothetical protein